MVFEPAGVTVLGYVDSVLLLLFFLLSENALHTLFRGREVVLTVAGSFEHDNINQPAIMLGRKPGKQDWFA